MGRITRHGPLFSLLQEPLIIEGVVVLALDVVGIGIKILIRFYFRGPLNRTEDFQRLLASSGRTKRSGFVFPCTDRVTRLIITIY